MFIALRWMQEPGGVMMGLTENIQACLRIFRRAQHLWLVRDILYLAQGVYYVFVLWSPQEYSNESLSCDVLPSRQHFWWAIYIRGRCPWLLFGSALQAPECMWRPIRGKEETSRGWGISVFVQLTQDFPGEQRNGGNNLPIGKTGKTFALTDYCAIFAPRTKNSANN